MNERLRGALLQRGLTVADLARRLDLDDKTVERWIARGRVPHRRNQRAAADILGVAPDYLWPDARHRDTYLGAKAAKSEIVGTYPDRSSVPRDVWLNLLKSATTNIDVLVFSGTFLAQTNPRIAAMLKERAAQGVQVRLCFGDPAGSAVQVRDREEGIGSTLGAKIRASLSYFTDLVDNPGCELRLHNTTLYASIFRYDSEAMINPHIWGRPASANPLLHVRDTGEEPMFRKYVESFDQVWDQATPWSPA